MVELLGVEFRGVSLLLTSYSSVELGELPANNWAAVAAGWTTFFEDPQKPRK